MDNNYSSSILRSQDIVIQIDNDDIHHLIKNNKLVDFYRDDKDFIYYKINDKKTYILNSIFDKKIVGHSIIDFSNGDKNNYCKLNIKVSDILDFPSGTLIKEYPGVISTSGKYKNIEMNKGYHVRDLNEEYVWMHIKEHIWTKVDVNIINSIRKLKTDKLIWNYNATKNQIEASYFTDKSKNIIVLHRYIYELHHNINKFTGLRHYNNDILDNRIENLYCNLSEIKKKEKPNKEDNKIYSYDRNKLEEKINEVYDIVSFDEGHCSTQGTKANQLLNPIWTVMERLNIANIYNIMYTANDQFVKFSLEDIDLMKTNDNKLLTWNVGENGYAFTNTEQKHTYMHRIILQHHQPNNDPKLSVDHINRDKLDNRRENLRWATQSLQNSNQDKRARKHNAQELPKELENIQLPKYAYYAKEIYNKETGATREFFRIEKHPNLESKCWSSSKSSKISILDKLEETKKKLYELDNDVQEEVSEEFVLPIGVRINENKARNNRELILDWRTEKLRYNLKMVYNENISLKDNFNIFKAKIKKKYPEFDKQNVQEI